MLIDRQKIARAIASKLSEHSGSLHSQWLTSKPIRHFYLDDLLPAADVTKLSNSFPSPEKLLHRSTLRERKSVGIEVERYDPCIAEYLFAFQEPEVVSSIAEITNLSDLEADPTLYASGISMMIQGDFLNPHIDNSHDGDAERYRVVNLLYYVSPDWQLSDGGNLELWNAGVTEPHTILSRFNRLVVMETDQLSWHSVSKVLADRARLCVSNYYFSRSATCGTDYSNVTTFTGRPEEPFRRIILNLDGYARNALGKAFPELRHRTKHRIK